MICVAAGRGGMTLWPGKRAESNFGGQWERNLPTDMRPKLDCGAMHVLAASQTRTTTPTPMRVLGCLLGGAAGDALGYRVEFLSRSEIEAWYGVDGIREPAHNGAGEAEVSDDTQMTADGLD